MPRFRKRININYIIAVPLIVMSYHIYNFYESEPIIVRGSLALSFDIMVVVCFYLLKDEYIAKLKRAKNATWAVLMVLIAFQLYVNIWAYADLHWFRAVISGSIFPVTVALISFIGMLRQQQVDIEADALAKRKEAVALTLDVATVNNLEAAVEERPWEDMRADKEHVISAYNNNPTEAGMDLFRGATNWRTIRRWWGKLDKGETP